MTATIAAPEERSTTAPAPGVRGAFRGAGASWAAVAAWGAGLVQLAVGAGALPQGDAARGAGIALLALGAAALVWGAVTLARGRIVVPRAGLTGALAGVVAIVAALAADPARTSVFAAAGAVVLLMTIAFTCAARLRAMNRGRADAAPPRVWAILVAATLVSGVVTPALAATEAGRSAVPHGEHLVDPGHH